MILIDAGPLVALVNRNDSYHAICSTTLREFASQRLLTTVPCVSEAMHLLHREGGFSYPQQLWALLLSGELELVALDLDQLRAVYFFMEKYQDYPMALADATLLVASSALRVKVVFTLDKGFRVFRLFDGSVLDIIP